MYILNDRLYFLMRPTDESRGSVDMFKPLMVQTDYGLLLTGSFHGVSIIEGFTSFSEKNPTIQETDESSTFIISDHEEKGQTVTLILSTPRSDHKVYGKTTIKRQYLKDMGLFGRFTDKRIERFMRICYAEKIPMEQVFGAISKTWFVSGSSPAFMKNASGISLDDLFSHPYAKAKKPPTEL